MQLDTVKGVFGQEGPYATVHLDVSRATEDAQQQLDARVTSTRHELERSAMPAGVIEDVEQRLREPTHLSGEVRRTIVATPLGTIFDDVRAGHTTWPETTAVGALPDLAGWLALVDGEFPFVLVVADREGADIDVFVAPSRPATAREEVHGSTLHITKVSPGDYAEPQYQRRSENVWMANAREVAQTVRAACAKHRPRLVMVAGDVRARVDVAEALEGLQVPVAQLDAGSRAAGSSRKRCGPRSTGCSRRTRRATRPTLWRRSRGAPPRTRGSPWGSMTRSPPLLGTRSTGWCSMSMLPGDSASSLSPAWVSRCRPRWRDPRPCPRTRCWWPPRLPPERR